MRTCMCASQRGVLSTTFPEALSSSSAVQCWSCCGNSVSSRSQRLPATGPHKQANRQRSQIHQILGALISARPLGKLCCLPLAAEQGCTSLPEPCQLCKTSAPKVGRENLVRGGRPAAIAIRRCLCEVTENVDVIEYVEALELRFDVRSSGNRCVVADRTRGAVALLAV